jgi:hypothetical protein
MKIVPKKAPLFLKESIFNTKHSDEIYGRINQNFATKNS